MKPRWVHLDLNLIIHTSIVQNAESEPLLLYSVAEASLSRLDSQLSAVGILRRVTAILVLLSGLATVF